MPSSYVLVPKVIRPRSEHGSDWGSKRFVIVRMGPKELQWRYACKEWMNLLEGYKPAPAWLMLVDYGKKPPAQSHSWNVIYDGGGRLSLLLIRQHREVINEFFGCDVASRASTRQTLEVKP